MGITKYIVLLAFLSISCVSYADGSHKRGVFNLTEIIIDSEFHHLGDDVTGVIPIPEGTEYERSFRLPRRALRGAIDAHIQYTAQGVEFAEIAINEHSLVMPQVHDVPGLLNVAPSIVSIPLAWLKRKNNVIRFESKATTAGSYDDIFFGDVRLLISTH